MKLLDTRIPLLYAHPLNLLYIEKCYELLARIALIEAYMKEDYQGIQSGNVYLFGSHSDSLYVLAENMISKSRMFLGEQKHVLGRLLTFSEIQQGIEAYCVAMGLALLPVITSSNTLSRISVTLGSKPYVSVGSQAEIYEKELHSILAHELGTHYKRYITGSQSGLHLFKHGTAFYIQDEEGLAVYNSFQFLPENYEKQAMYWKYYLSYSTDGLNFVQTANLLQEFFPHKSLSHIFSDTVRLKRGLIHTDRNVSGGTYRKDTVYLNGYTRISAWIHAGGDVERLFFGKVKISDLDILSYIY